MGKMKEISYNILTKNKSYGPFGKNKTFDSFNKKISEYFFEKIRFIHIEKVRI